MIPDPVKRFGGPRLLRCIPAAVLLLLLSCGPPLQEQVREEVEGLLVRQVTAWNAEDLEAFVSLYAEDATFVSPDGVVRGREEILRRYRERYPVAHAMGALSLQVLEVRPLLGEDGEEVLGATVVARWRIAYGQRPALGGLTLLVLDKRPDGWTIIQDASM